MSRLAVYLRTHSGPIEADFAREYPRDEDQLVEFWRGRLTVRRALVLIDHLPPGAALWRALQVDTAWSEATHLAAQQLDLLQLLNWRMAGEPGQPPDQTQRPGVLDRKALIEAHNRARAARFLARKRARETEGGSA